MENTGLSEGVEMMNNRKAFFFTMIAVIILSLFLASFSLYSEVQDRKSVQKRVDTMNSFLSSVEKDLSRKLYISTYRVVFLAESKIITDRAYITNLSGFFEDAFIRGKVGSNDNVLELQGYNISAIVKDVKEDSGLVGANFTIDERSIGITVSQTDPWHVKVTLILNMTLSDNEQVALINRTSYEVSAYVPITNFEDPLYFMRTSGAVTNPIAQSPYSFRSDNILNFSRHVNNSYYYANPAAPSFLQRLSGNLTNESNGNGIESFVNLQKIQAQGVSIDSGKSTVDYIYFGSSDPAYYTVTGMPAWFKMDNSTISATIGRLALYNISSYTGPTP
jgi:hypothetical protein